MSLLVAHVGKPRLPFVREGIEHFRRKIRPLAALRLVEVREEPLRKGVSPKEVHRKERDRIRKIMDRTHHWVALDDRGRTFSSQGFATLMESWRQQGKSRVAFLVAGPCGFSPEIVAEADLALSLSPMTLSHETAILVLLEQIFRALAILNRLPYPR
jgi:23S rRNA (pseudouridine1915-N3)-methyltransferase